MKEILRYKKQVADDVQRLLDNRPPGLVNHWRADVHDRLSRYLSGGKLLRGSLLRFSHDAFGGQSRSAARTAAASLELLHCALLIHDDVMDRDETRRGKPAMHLQYQRLASSSAADARHFGESLAICAADAAIFKTMTALGSLKAPEKQKVKLLSLFGNVLESVCYGQMLDIELGEAIKTPARQSVEAVMEQKTAIYTLSLPLAAGAILADQPAACIKKLEEIGRLAGAIFQIRDDELGIFGDPSKTGKPIGSDIKEGKKTLLHHYVMLDSNPATRRKLAGIFGNPHASASDIAHVRKSIIDLGILSKIDQEIALLSRDASLLIDKLSIDDKHKRSLHRLVAFCSARDV